jgi:Histone deacetylase domain
MAQIWRRSGRGGASWLLGQGAGRVAYVDVDVHHGDGVQAAFYGDPPVLTISLHEHPAALRPGTGLPSETGGPEAPRSTTLAHQVAGGRWLPNGGGGYDLLQVVPRIWRTCWPRPPGHTIDPGARIPAAWRELAFRCTGRRVPEFMTEGNEPRLRALRVRIRPCPARK